jgi:glycosyltransferase involved in cell wall biosynthesis
MLATSRDYKGVPEFFKLARLLSDTDFKLRLVTNDEPEFVASYFAAYRDVPENIELIPRTGNLPPLYEAADVVVNLSRVDEWIETFGLTLLEAMTFGIPVIAPPVGGPIELLGDDLARYLVDAANLEKIAELIRELHSHEELYLAVSQCCRERAASFGWDRFVSEVGALPLQ